MNSIQPYQVPSSKRPSRALKLATALMAGTLMLSGCVTDANSYSRSNIGYATELVPGRLVGIEPVEINGTNSGVGAVSGAALGGVLGSRVGRNNRGYRRGGNAAAGIGFAILGGLVGAAIEEGATGGNGFRYTIELEDGRDITVVQQDKTPVASIGSDVRVEYGRITRVLPG